MTDKDLSSLEYPDINANYESFLNQNPSSDFLILSQTNDDDNSYYMYNTYYDGENYQNYYDGDNDYVGELSESLKYDYQDYSNYDGGLFGRFLTPDQFKKGFEAVDEEKIVVPEWNSSEIEEPSELNAELQKSLKNYKSFISENFLSRTNHCKRQNSNSIFTSNSQNTCHKLRIDNSSKNVIKSRIETSKTDIAVVQFINMLEEKEVSIENAMESDVLFKQTLNSMRKIEIIVRDHHQNDQQNFVVNQYSSSLQNGINNEGSGSNHHSNISDDQDQYLDDLENFVTGSNGEKIEASGFIENFHYPDDDEDYFNSQYLDTYDVQPNEKNSDINFKGYTYENIDQKEVDVEIISINTLPEITSKSNQINKNANDQRRKHPKKFAKNREEEKEKRGDSLSSSEKMGWSRMTVFMALFVVLLNSLRENIF